MLDIFLDKIDIFFTILICILYLMNIFFTKDLLFRFLIFLGSMFVGIINYAFILYKQENFLMFLLLNCFFIIIVIFLLLFSKVHPEILKTQINIYFSNATNIVVITLLSILFIGFSYIFINISLKENINTEKASLVINKKVFIKNNNNVDVQNEIQNLKTDTTDFYYLKKIKAFESSNFILKYNSIIILYIIYIILMYFLSKNYIKE